jgi:hypothetical protein
MATQNEKQFYINRLTYLYDEAKARHDGASLTIYQDVSDMLDRLEGDAPEGYDVLSDADALCGRLRVS